MNKLKWSIIVFQLFISSFTFGQQNVQNESLLSTHLFSIKNDELVLHGTGFIIKPKETCYLITNWHVLKNQDPINGTWVDTLNKQVPEIVTVTYRVKGNDEVVYGAPEKLYNDDGSNKFKEFFYKGQLLDIVALELENIDTNIVEVHILDYRNTYDDSKLKPGDFVSVVGFPYGGESASALPFWKSGFISTEPNIHQQELPATILDLKVQPGMSGSPVYYFPSHIDQSSDSSMPYERKSYFYGVIMKVKRNETSLALKATYLKGLFDQLD